MKTFPIWKLGYKTTRDLLIQPFTEDELFCPLPFLWQSEFEDICVERLISLIASTGAGKSRAIKVSSYKWNKISREHKTIIVVPQTAIGSEFGPGFIKLKSGEIIYWTVGDNLCRDTSEKTVSTMLDFFESCPENQDLRTIVCCHATLCLAYEQIKNKECLKNIKLIIDEAHHVSTGEDEDGNYTPNKMGEIFLKISKELSNSILLVTATHFRTDETTIIPSEDVEKYRHFEVPFYRVQDECRFYNKQIQFNYSVYKTDMHEGLSNCFDESLKTIIFIHPKVAKDGKVKKLRVVQNVVKSLGEILSIDKKTGTYLVKTPTGRELVVADLVTESLQGSAKEYIRFVSKDEKSFKVDVIVAMNMFKEGSDYPPLQHCIIHGIRNSYGDIIQMAGRSTRDFIDKTFCRVTMLLPHDLNITQDNAREILNNHLKFIVSSMSLANFFKPVHLRIKDVKKRNDNRENGPRVNPLSILGDDVAQNNLRVEAIKQFSSLAENNDDAKISYDVRLDLMKKAVKDNSEIELTDEQTKDIAETILNECALAIISRNSSIDIDSIDYDFLKNVDTTEFLFNFCSDLLGSSDIKEYKRSILNIIGEKKSLEEHIKIIKENEIRNSRQWCKYHTENNLIDVGYYGFPWSAFDISIKELFDSIWGGNKSLEDHVKMFKENNITGPTRWNEYKKINNSFSNGYYNYPWEAFDMKQKQFFDSIWGEYKNKEEHIKLIKNNNITGPTGWGQYWKENNLSKEKYFTQPWTSFDAPIKEFFDSIWGEKLYKTKEEHIELIKRKNIKSVSSWIRYWKDNNLSENGYISKAYRKFGMSAKTFFDSIWGERKKVYKSKEEHIKLIKENNITGATGWEKYLKENELAMSGYYYNLSQPFDMSEKDFFDSIWGEKIYKSEEDHITLIKTRNIKSNTHWLKYWRKNNLSRDGYYGDPWRAFNTTSKKFFNSIWGEVRRKTKEEHIELIKQNNIQGKTQWQSFFDNNNLLSKGYFKFPWGPFKVSCKEWSEIAYVKK